MVSGSMPLGLAFTGGTPGSIFNAATLSNVQPGKSITLVGGTVISTGDIKTAGGNISIATVEGGKYVQIQSDGSILRLDLPVSAGNIAPEAKAFTALSLPRLLTNTGVDLAATGVKNENGVVTLVGNPAANALVPDLDKAKADYQKANADFQKVNADFQKVNDEYYKALAAANSNGALIDPAINNANNAAISALGNSETTLRNSNKALDAINSNINALSTIGESRAISEAIALGDTVSKQNRPIASGDVITRNLGTSLVGKNGGSVYIKSSQAILNGNINTSYENPVSSPPDNPLKIGGNVFLDAQTEIKVKTIDTSARPRELRKGYNGGNVTLFTQTKDIIVDSITTLAGFDENSYNPDTRLTKAQSTGFLGGNVTIKSAGLFRVITTGGISSSLFGVININHGSKKPFASGVTGESVSGQSDRIIIPGFTFPDGASGSRGAIVTSRGTNGSIGIIYKDQPIVNSPFTNDPAKNSGDGKTGTELARNTSGDNSEEQDSTSQASKQKTKCKNSLAIASAKLGADPTRSGNSANAAAEEFCPPNNSNSGILQILTDRN
jgi:hypothetical protein